MGADRCPALGYLQFAVQTGFTLTDDLFTEEGTGTPTQGTLVWVTFVLEALFAGIASAGMARATAIGPISR